MEALKPSRSAANCAIPCAPDAETPLDVGGTDGDNNYVVRVRVQDNGSPVLGSEIDVTVAVQDVVETLDPEAHNDVFTGTVNMDPVLTAPGHTSVTPIPCRRRSKRRTSDTPRSPNLAALYGPCHGSPNSPAAEDTFTR